jgi:predicted DNA-binding transcriptional regulator AlpA
MNEPLLNINDLAQQVKIPVKTIRNKMSEGSWPIPPLRIGRAIRWVQSDVDRAIADLALRDRAPTINSVERSAPRKRSIAETRGSSTNR